MNEQVSTEDTFDERLRSCREDWRKHRLDGAVMESRADLLRADAILDEWLEHKKAADSE